MEDANSQHSQQTAQDFNAVGTNHSIQSKPDHADAEMTGDKNPILRAVQESFEALLAVSTATMRTQQKTDVPVDLHYEIKRKVVESVPDNGRVQAANIISCREWKARPFDAVYLEAERKAIQNRHLKVDRYFIGTVDEFTDREVIENLKKHREAGVRVRHAYITPEMAQMQDFKRDIGYHESMPHCVTEGIREEGFMWKGSVATSREECTNAEVIFRILSEHSPNFPEQEHMSKREHIARSVAGWARFWEDQGSEQSADPGGLEFSPMLGNLERMIRENLGRRQERSAQFNIVDAGCGDGKNLVYCIEVCNRLSNEFPGAKFDITGAEICPQAVDLCHDRLKQITREQNVVARVLERDVSIDIPAVTDSVDILFGTDIFIHILPAELNSALAEWRRVLRRRGRLLFNVNRIDDDIFEDCRTAAEKGDEGCEEVKEFAHAWWFRDTFYRYYSLSVISDILTTAGFSKYHPIAEERRELPHGRYRNREHFHRNYIIDAFSNT